MALPGKLLCHHDPLSSTAYGFGTAVGTKFEVGLQWPTVGSIRTTRLSDDCDRGVRGYKQRRDLISGTGIIDFTLSRKCRSLTSSAEAENTYRSATYKVDRRRSSHQNRSWPLWRAGLRQISGACSIVGMLHLQQRNGSTRDDAMRLEWGSLITPTETIPSTALLCVPVNISSSIEILVAGSETNTGRAQTTQHNRAQRYPRANDSLHRSYAIVLAFCEASPIPPFLLRSRHLPMDWEDTPISDENTTIT